MQSSSFGHHIVMSLCTDVLEENAASFLKVEGIELELTIRCVKTKKAIIWFISAALTFLIAATVIVLLNFCSARFDMHECLMTKLCPSSVYQEKSV